MGTAAWAEVCPGPEEVCTYMMRRVLAFGLLGALLVSGMAYLVPRAAAEDYATNVTASVEPSQNPLVPCCSTFSPGDDIRVDLTGVNGPDGLPDIFDVGLFNGAGRAQANLMILANDVALVNGRAVAIFPGSSTRLLDDGQYQIDVCYQDYSLTYNCAGTNHKLVGFSPTINIQLYTVSVTTDRDGYIPGETVTAFWKALYIKNGTPANGFSGNLYFYEGLTTRQYSYTPTKAVGNTSFAIPTGANTGLNHSVTFTWSGFNPGARNGVITRGLVVGNMILNVYPSAYNIPAGSPFTVYVQTYVNSIFYPLPAVPVNISFYMNNPSPVPPTYYSDLRWSLTTDSAGRASIALMATNHFVANANYGVIANGTKILKQASSVATFSITPPAYPITVTLTLDGSRYLAGSMATASVVAQESPGRGAPVSYDFVETVRDVFGFTVSRREDILSTGTISYQLPLNLDGSVWVSVSVYNGVGDYGGASVTATVAATELILNADPQIYQAGQAIHVNYASGLSNPNYLYSITYGTYTLTQGNTTATSFSFDIPASPAPSYTIFVQATGGGRTASSYMFISLRSGFAVHVSWDKTGYSPGDTAQVRVRTEAFGISKLPDAFRVQICIASCSGPSIQSYLTSKSDDTFTYHIDAATDSADTGAVVYVYSAGGGFLAASSQVLSVRASSNPLWFTRLADVPLMEWILLALIIVLFVLFFFKGGFGGGLLHLRRGSKPSGTRPSRPARESPPPPGMANCSNCGSPIDVTTSKRPVEVLCPHCGETTTVEREPSTTGGWEPPSRAGRAPP